MLDDLTHDTFLMFLRSSRPVSETSDLIRDVLGD